MKVMQETVNSIQASLMTSVGLIQGKVYCTVLRFLINDLILLI
jgi:hypothetical protein